MESLFGGGLDGTVLTGTLRTDDGSSALAQAGTLVYA